jgi:hypothetical protein
LKKFTLFERLFGIKESRVSFEKLTPRKNIYAASPDEVFVHGQKPHQVMPFYNSKMLHLLIESKLQKLITFGSTTVFVVGTNGIRPQRHLRDTDECYWATLARPYITNFTKIVRKSHFFRK